MNPTRAWNHTGTAGIAPNTSTWTGSGIADNGRADCGADSLPFARCWSHRNILVRGHWHRHCAEPPPQLARAVPDAAWPCAARSSCPGIGCGRGKNRRSKFLQGNIGRGTSDSKSGRRRTTGRLELSKRRHCEPARLDTRERSDLSDRSALADTKRADPPLSVAVFGTDVAGTRRSSVFRVQPRAGERLTSAHEWGAPSMGRSPFHSANLRGWFRVRSYHAIRIRSRPTRHQKNGHCRSHGYP